MGEVFAAYDEELDRRVAIKVLGRGVRSSARDRMRREAKAMAKLAHPNVVSVYEVGEDDGELFIAMEYVEGSTLAAWQSSESRGWKDVLGVYRQAGEGLAAAHRAGVVHRDFKPNNAMVTEGAGRLRVRVLDFGIARRDATVTEDSLDDSVDLSAGDPQLTHGTGLLGTPAYMAPEQFGTANVTEAADQFALCVSIWEGLFGERPFERANLVDLQGTRTELRAPKRGRGVPVWVRAAVTRGLAHEPGARWPSVEALLEALDHSGRSKRRNWALGAGLLTAVAVGSWVAGGQTPEPCAGAEARLAEVWSEDGRAAVDAAILRTELPYAPRARDLAFERLDAFGRAWVEMHTETCRASTVRGERSAQWMDARMSCLDRALDGVAATIDVLADADGDVVDNVARVVSGMPSLEPCASADGSSARAPVPPSEKAAIQDVQGRLSRAAAERQAGRFDRAQSIVDEVDAKVGALEYGPVRMHSLIEHGRVLVTRAKYAEAQARFESAFELAIDLQDWGAVHETSDLLLTTVGMSLGKPEQALAAYRRLAVHSARTDRERAGVYSTLSTVLRGAGEYAEAEKSARRAIALHEKMNAEGWTLSAARNHLATALMEQGRVANAETLFAQSVEDLSEQLGALHPNVLVERNNYASILGMQGKAAASEREFRTVYQARREVLGPKHPKTLDTRCNLAITLHQLGRHEESASIFRDAIPGLEEALGAEHRIVGRAYLNQAETLSALRQHAAAEASAANAVEVWRTGLGAEHPRVGQATYLLADVIARQARYDDAAVHAHAALQIFEASLGEMHLRTAQVHFLLGRIAFERGDLGVARQSLERASAILREVESEVEVDVGVGSLLARTLLGQGEEALVVARSNYDRATDAQLIEPLFAADAALALAQASWAAATSEDARAKARGFAREALQTLEGASASPDHDELRAQAQAWLDAHG
jgi:tetratricopeptide (TPR) repeat protein